MKTNTSTLTEKQILELRDDLINYECLEAMASDISIGEIPKVTEEISQLVYEMPIEKVILNLDAVYGEDWEV